ncbi:MAG: arsenate reductase (glutaredoxin) [Steroidobacteraceae bacterium]
MAQHAEGIVTIWHNPACGTSRNVLGLIREAGIEPVIIEYLKAPPDRETLHQLLAEMAMSPRQLLREKGTPYHELGLAADHWTDDQLIDLMIAQPILINRPIVRGLGATRLCRPSETVRELLKEYRP